MAKIPSDELERERHFSITVGFIIRQWAHMELTLMLMLTPLLGGDQFRARIVWLTMPSLRTRLILMSRLGETYLDTSILPEFRALMRRVKSLGHNRNLLAHAVGGLNSEGKFEHMADNDSDDMGIEFSVFSEMPLANILDWPYDIDNLDKELSKFTYEKLVKNLHPSTRLHREERAAKAVADKNSE